jgi:hypothetical protein
MGHFRPEQEQPATILETLTPLPLGHWKILPDPWDRVLKTPPSERPQVVGPVLTF